MALGDPTGWGGPEYGGKSLVQPVQRRWKNLLGAMKVPGEKKVWLGRLIRESECGIKQKRKTQKKKGT